MPIPQQDVSITRVTAKEKVYKTLQEWIIQGIMVPGERLNDMELAKYFNVSRTPVREAIQMLAEEKLLNVVSSSGTFVSEINMDDMKNVYYLLGELQEIALDLCIREITDEEIQTLRRINEAFLFSASHHKPVETMSADRKFHRYIVELSKNPYLLSFTDQLLLHSCRNEIRFFKFDDLTMDSYNTHCDIIEAIIARNSLRAKELLKFNWTNPLEKQMVHAENDQRR